MIGRILMLFALVISAAATLYYVALSGPAESVQAPGVMVRVAAAHLRPGGFLDEGDAPLERRPEWPEIDEYVTERGPDMLGSVIIAPIDAGKPIPRAALLAPGQDGFLAAVLRPGMRAVSIGVDAVSGNAGHVFPGDRIDLLLTQRLSRSDGRDWATETILRNARVIAVDQRLNEDPASRSASDVARTITLEATPRDAERIALARNLGTLSLTLRSFLIENPHEMGVDREGPLWSGDISRARREGAEIEADPAAAQAQIQAQTQAPTPAPPRRVMVLRGPSSGVFDPEEFSSGSAASGPGAPAFPYPAPGGASAFSIPPLPENPR